MDYHTLEPKQQEQAKNNQIKNDAGGYVFGITPQQQLDRFLMLGTLGGTYYVGTYELTLRNMNVIKQLIVEDYKYVVDRVVEISQAGRAPKNDPALYVLALCAASENEGSRQLALRVLPDVARTATHLFKFLNYVQSMRGWGRSLKNAVGQWYTGKSDRALLYQVLKYRNREGWTHKDVLRKAHPIPQNEFQNDLFKWITSDETSEILLDNSLFNAYCTANGGTLNVQEIAYLTEQARLTREMIPTQHLKEPVVMKVLLQNMPLTAMIRNLANMAGIGLLVDGNWDVINKIKDTITNEEFLSKARIHPMVLYQAMRVYESGKNRRYQWKPVGEIVAALETAFYKSFEYLEPTNMRYLLGLDVSGSMGMGTCMEGITAREASAVMAMAVLCSEQNVLPMAFSCGFQPLDIHRNMSLAEVINKISRLSFDSTDCALPMLYATENKIPVDVFVIFTDNETYYGEVHPYRALQQYREKMGIDAKLIVVAMEAAGFSIADPDDAGMLDIAGFDTHIPALISEFAS